MGEGAPTHLPTLYVRRTREREWCWRRDYSRYPLSVLDNNGLIVSMTRPADGDLCPECLALTNAKESTP